MCTDLTSFPRSAKFKEFELLSNVVVLAGVFGFLLVAIVALTQKSSYSGFAANSGTIENGASKDQFAFLKSKENWVQVHFSLPMKIRLLYVDSTVKCTLILFVWEYAETLAYALLKTGLHDAQFNTTLVGDPTKKFTEWFGESPGDSMLGDVTLGFLAVLLAAFFRHYYYPNVKDAIYACRSSRGFMLHLCLFVFEALLNSISTFELRLKSPIQMPNGGVFELVPVGHMLYVFLSLIITEYMKRIDVYFVDLKQEEHTGAVLGMYSVWQTYHVVTWCSTFYYLVYTYLSVTVAAALTTFVLVVPMLKKTRQVNQTDSAVV